MATLATRTRRNDPTSMQRPDKLPWAVGDLRHEAIAMKKDRVVPEC